MALLYVHVGQRLEGMWADRQRQEKHKVTAIVAQARVFEAGEYKLEKITMKKPSLYLEIIFPGDPVPRSLWIRPGYLSQSWQVVEASKECGEPEVGIHCANRAAWLLTHRSWMCLEEHGWAAWCQGCHVGGFMCLAKATADLWSLLGQVRALSPCELLCVTLMTVSRNDVCAHDVSHVCADVLAGSDGKDLLTACLVSCPKAADCNCELSPCWSCNRASGDTIRRSFEQVMLDGFMIVAGCGDKTNAKLKIAQVELLLITECKLNADC